MKSVTALLAVGVIGAGAAGATIACADSTVKSRAAAGGVKLVKVGGGFDQPLYVTGAPGDRSRVFVVQQGGKIRIIRKGKTLSTPFLDITSLVKSGGEQGLLGLAFPRNYRSTGYFYVYYTTRDGRERLAEYKRSTADRADPNSARVVFTHDDPEPNHNGGQLQFGPDGYLYVGTGDGGGANDQHGSRGNAQSLSSPLGKILRINPRAASGFTVPSSNPFVSRSGALGEIYSYGLRNPWRFSFDRRTGDLVIGDVGQDAVEEIDFVRRGKGAGANFGWRPFEGTRRVYPNESAPGAVSPVIQQYHSDGWCSITGGYVVRDRKVRALYGRYVYGDFCKGRIYAAKLATGKATSNKPLSLPTIQNLSSFGEDSSGHVYVVSLSGSVYRFAAS